jgi:putative radical SAM enzyme (TIGR03279 family)
LLERMRRLAAAGIRMHAQIVLCPGLNDEEHLARTVHDLAALHPGVTTVAVVPVGLTRHRDGLPPLRSVTPDEARSLLAAIHAWQGEHRCRLATRLVYAADELYLLAGAPIPPASAYEGFPVVEDGIGLVRRFEDAWQRARRPPRGTARAVTVVTGELFAPVLRRLLQTLDEPGLAVDVVAVRNDFFGPAITVAGLLTGADIARALTDRPLGDAVLVPAVALQETRGVFLDDVAPADLARHLGVPVEAPEATADGLRAAVFGRAGASTRRT